MLRLGFTCSVPRKAAIGMPRISKITPLYTLLGIVNLHTTVMLSLRGLHQSRSGTFGLHYYYLGREY